jgi:hypothetical protein
MAVGWRNLITAPVSPYGYFPTFLRQGLKVLQHIEPIEFPSLIKTAIKRFTIKGNGVWGRPGDDLDRFPVEISRDPVPVVRRPKRREALWQWWP